MHWATRRTDTNFQHLSYPDVLLLPPSLAGSSPTFLEAALSWSFSFLPAPSRSNLPSTASFFFTSWSLWSSCSHPNIAPVPLPTQRPTSKWHRFITPKRNETWLVNVHPAGALIGSSMLGTGTDIKAHKFKPDSVEFVWTPFFFSDIYRPAKIGAFFFFFPLATWSNRRYNPEKKANPPSSSAKPLLLNLGTAGSSPKQQEQLLTCGKN